MQTNRRKRRAHGVESYCEGISDDWSLTVLRIMDFLTGEVFQSTSSTVV